jgi:A/G-specific adenine glycosylase
MKSILRIESIQSKLLQWYKKNHRDLPWRNTRDPYAIWVSEIMLQQTQVDTVVPYYQEFLKSFPTIHHLARADLSKVLKAWEGLGYYSRARNLHRASKVIANRFRGEIPDHLKDLLGLPGIGRSTAGAILSFAFGQEAAILDGNVKRVLSRLFAVSGESEQALWRISESLIPKGHSNPFNQALMDLGSLLCTPKNPQCSRCPLKNVCMGRVFGDPEKYPVKRLKKPIPHIEAISAVIQRDGKVLLKQRPPEGFLGGLWEFPNWKIEEKRNIRLKLRLRNHIKKETGIDAEVKESIGTFQQTYSHFKLTLYAYHCQAIGKDKHGSWTSTKKLPSLPMSKIHRKIAETIPSK